MPMPPLLLVSDARSIQLFSSCIGVRAIDGFLRRAACPPAGIERCAAGWRVRAFLAEAASAPAHSVMTVNIIAIAGDRIMRTSTLSHPAARRSNRSRAIGGSRPQLRGGARVLRRAFDLAGE